MRCYIQDYSHLHSDQCVCCKVSHLDSCRYSCGHSFYQSFLFHRLHYRNMFYKRTEHVCLKTGKMLNFNEKYFSVIFSVAQQLTQTNKKYTENNYEIYLCHKEVLSTQQHSPSYTDRSRGYRQHCLYSFLNNAVYSLDHTILQRILYVRIVKL